MRDAWCACITWSNPRKGPLVEPRKKASTPEAALLGFGATISLSELGVVALANHRQ